MHTYNIIADNKELHTELELETFVQLILQLVEHLNNKYPHVDIAVTGLYADYILAKKIIHYDTVSDSYPVVDVIECHNNYIRIRKNLNGYFPEHLIMVYQ